MQGLTLVELLMTLIIVSIVMASIYNVLQHSLAAHSHVEAQAEVIQNARMAMERFSKEVRRAASFITTCTATTVIFGIDFNGDGDVTDDSERIQYTFSGGTLNRRDRPASGAWRPYVVIADYVTGFTLSYRDASNNILPPPLNTAGEVNAIRLISADLALQKQRKGGEDIYPVELRATIHPRNR